MQSVANRTAEPGVASSNHVLPHTFVVIDHEIICTVSLLLQLIQKVLVSVTSKGMCTNYWLTV